MKTITMIFFNCFLFVVTITAQTFEVPTDYKFTEASDYAQYEKDIIDCVDWLVTTPLDQEAEKRILCNRFLIQWLIGSPNVHIALDTDIIRFHESPELLIIFMGGWAKDTLEKNTNNSPKAIKEQSLQEIRSGTLAGLLSVISFYEKNKHLIPKDKNIEKFIKMKKKGKLEEFIMNYKFTTPN